MASGLLALWLVFSYFYLFILLVSDLQLSCTPSKVKKKLWTFHIPLHMRPHFLSTSLPTSGLTCGQHLPAACIVLVMSLSRALAQSGSSCIVPSMCLKNEQHWPPLYCHGELFHCPRHLCSPVTPHPQTLATHLLLQVSLTQRLYRATLFICVGCIIENNGE